MTQRVKGLLLLLASAILTSTIFVFVKYLLTVLNVETFIVLWLSSAFIFSVVFLVLSGNIAKEKDMIKQRWKPILLIGIVHTFNIVLAVLALKLIDPSVASFVTRSAVIFSILLGVIVLREKFHKGEIAGIILAVCGVFIISYGGGKYSILGIVLCLISALSLSVVELIVKLTIKDISPLTLIASRSLIPSVLVLIYSLSLGKIDIPVSKSLLLVPIGAFLGPFLGFLLYFKALRYIEMSKATTFFCIQPFFVIILAAVILGTHPSFLQVIGGILIISGIVIIINRQKLSNYANDNREH